MQQRKRCSNQGPKTKDTGIYGKVSRPNLSRSWPGVTSRSWTSKPWPNISQPRRKQAKSALPVELRRNGLAFQQALGPKAMVSAWNASLWVHSCKSEPWIARFVPPARSRSRRTNSANLSGAQAPRADVFNVLLLQQSARKCTPRLASHAMLFLVFR